MTFTRAAARRGRSAQRQHQLTADAVARPAPVPGRRVAHCPCAGACPRCSSSRPLDAGQPIDAGVRRPLEASYHADLSGIRVHTGPAATEAARRQGAHAFTIGSHIVFGREQYAPHTRRGVERIAHEVAHTLQQRRAARAMDGSTYGRAEQEASAAAGAACGGDSVSVSMSTGGLVQRQDADETPRPLTSQPQWQLHLDPEFQSVLLQNYIRWWIGSSIVQGDAPAQGNDTAQGAGTTATSLVPLPHALPSSFFEPFEPSSLANEPDLGAILVPYNARNVPLGARDVDAATAVFRQNAGFVNALPDLRSAAPSFLRPLIPSTWRRSMAEAFTAATLNAQLRHDYPTPIEAADLSFYRMTGISTTYIPIPGFSF